MSAAASRIFGRRVACATRASNILRILEQKKGRSQSNRGAVSQEEEIFMGESLQQER